MQVLYLRKFDNIGESIWSRKIDTINDPNKRQIILHKVNSYGDDILVQKYESYKLTNGIVNTSITTDEDENIYITYFTDGSITTSANSNLGRTDIVIYKIENNGNIEWIKQIPTLNSTNSEINPKIKLDKSKNIYLCYLTNGTIGTINTGGYDIVLSKLDKYGNVLWIKQEQIFNTNMNDINNNFDVDINGNSYIVYQSKSSILNSTSKGGYDIIITKINSDSTIEWTIQENNINTTGNDTRPVVATYNNNCYVAFVTDGVIQNGINTGLKDIVIIKLDENGKIIYRSQSKSINSIHEDLNPSLYIDKKGFIYLSYERRRPNARQLVILKLSDTLTTPVFTVESQYSCGNNIQYNMIELCPDIKYTQHHLLKKISQYVKFYDVQIKTINELFKTMTNILNDCKKISFDINLNKGIIFNIGENINKYVLLSKSKFNNMNITYSNNLSIFGTIDDNGKPVYCINGQGGLSNTELYGDFNIVIKNNTYTYTLLQGEDLNFLANKIQSNLCGRIDVVNGNEFGICINSMGTVELTLFSYSNDSTMNSKSKNFTIYSIDESENFILMGNIKSHFGDFISYIGYDKNNKIIRVIMKGAYLLKIKQIDNTTDGQLTIKSYINNIEITSKSSIYDTYLYLYGYILFYYYNNDLEKVIYPENFLVSQTVEVKKISLYNCIKNNITFNLENCLDHNLNDTDFICFYNGNYDKKISIKNFNSEYYLLNLLKTYWMASNDLYNIWRTGNMIKIFEKYLIFLTNIKHKINAERNNLIIFTNSYFK